MSRCTKNPFGTIPSVQQEVGHFDFPCHFFSISMPHIFMNSSYRFNTRDVTFAQYHLQTLQMKRYQKLSPMSYLVSGAVPSIFKLCHETQSPYNFNIRFPISTKLFRNAEGVSLHRSMHQYFIKFRFHLICITFAACFLHTIHYNVTCK